MHFPTIIHNSDSYMSMFEQQSTKNPNMPLRGLMYFGNLYDSYIESNGLNIYGKKLIKIPTPQYYVLYNGTEEEEAVDKAVRFCIENDVLKEYLITHRAEVLSVCLKEFNEEVFVAAIREEGREEGFEEGRKVGLKILVDVLREYLPDEESIYQKIIENENYKDVLREDVAGYMNK